MSDLNIPAIKQYRCNFKLKDSDKYALVKCPKCHGENYASNVLSGICTWCGFNINTMSKIADHL